jgi:hypothetical protein
MTYAYETSILPALSAAACLKRSRLWVRKGDFAGATENFQAIACQNGWTP